MQEPLLKVDGTRTTLQCLGPHDHPCLVYDDPAEQAEAYVPYLYAGLTRGELCIYVADETHPEFVFSAFRSRGIDIDAFVKNEAFKVITKHDAYLTGGYFDTAKMVQFWKDTVDQALANGFSAVRAAAEMTWALGSEPGCELLVPYESELNGVFPKLKVSALCQYHRKRFPAGVVKEIIHVHPIVVAGGEVLANPTFVGANVVDEPLETREELEVQNLLDVLSLANTLKARNLQLEAAVKAQEHARNRFIESDALRKDLEKALLDEQQTRKYAESVKQELEEFVNNASEGLHWVGPDGTILWANRAELEMLGYSKDEYVGRNIREFHADADGIEDIFVRLQQKDTLKNYPARLRAKDGSLRFVLINSNVLWRQGKFVHTQCFTRDITDLEMAKQRAARVDEISEMNDELHLLARTISHELQEPIAKIRSYLNLLSVRYKGQLGKDADEFIDICTSSAKVVHRLIDDLWLFARITKVQDGDVQMIASDNLAAGVVHEYRNQIATAKAKVSIGEMPRLKYSEKQLRYIFDSLLNNALKYRRSDVEPEVRIEAELRENEWVFSVKDNGIGIDTMHFRDIFRAFYRIEAATDRGTGMGLAICQKIVASQGGRMWVESELGTGSTFYFTIPVLHQSFMSCVR